MQTLSWTRPGEIWGRSLPHIIYHPWMAFRDPRKFHLSISYFNAILAIQLRYKWHITTELSYPRNNISCPCLGLLFLGTRGTDDNYEAAWYHIYAMARISSTRPTTITTIEATPYFVDISNYHVFSAPSSHLYHRSYLLCRIINHV